MKLRDHEPEDSRYPGPMMSGALSVGGLRALDPRPVRRYARANSPDSGTEAGSGANRVRAG